MSDLTPLFQSVFAACASNVAPMVGIELAPGEITSESRAEPPEGELGVLPLHVETGSNSKLTLTLSTPLQELATLGRRMLSEDDPDKEGQELNADVLDAIGEVLNLMSGGIDQGLREHLEVGGSPGAWWRTDDPGEESFESGEFILGQTTLAASEGTPVVLYLRVPTALLELSEGGGLRKDRLGRFGLVGLPDDVRSQIEGALTESGAEAVVLERDDPYFLKRCAGAAMVIVGEESGLDVCRRIRIANETWSLPTIVCLSEPTRERVLEALDQGASHVLRVPFDEGLELVKVITSLRVA